MKKFFIAFALVMGFACAANAQARSIGARLGYGIEAAYQHALGDNNMISAELGLGNFNNLSVAATYDWLFPITSWSEAGSWNWYLGVGAAANIYSGVGLGVAGRAGIEYNFEIPLILSIDYKPVLGVAISNGGSGFYGGYYGVALSARYRF